MIVIAPERVEHGIEPAKRDKDTTQHSDKTQRAHEKNKTGGSAAATVVSIADKQHTHTDADAATRRREVERSTCMTAADRDAHHPRHPRRLPVDVGLSASPSLSLSLSLAVASPYALLCREEWWLPCLSRARLSALAYAPSMWDPAGGSTSIWSLCRLSRLLTGAVALCVKRRGKYSYYEGARLHMSGHRVSGPLTRDDRCDVMGTAGVFCHSALALTMAVAGGAALVGGAGRHWLWRGMGISMAIATGACKV